MHHYTYLSKDNLRYYIGVRSSNKEPSIDKYMGSFYDKTFTPHTKIILSNHYTRKDAILAEIYWHKLFEVDTNPLFVNQARQTSSKFDYDWTGKKLSPEHKRKLSIAAKKRYKTSKHPWLGRKHTEKSRQKMSNSLSGEKSPWYGRKHKEATKKKQSDARGHKCRGYKNLEVYHFFCCETGEEYIGIPSDFAKAYGISMSSVSSLVNFKVKSSRGWIIL